MSPAPAGGGVIVVMNQAAVHALLSSELGPVGRDLTRRALRVEAAAKRVCPVDTGRLRSSITHALAQDGGDVIAMVGTNVEYALDVEFGTSKMRAQPYLRPALSAAGGISRSL